jgi:two-component system OmpR family response regulator
MRLLLIEDDTGIAEALNHALGLSYRIDHAINGEEGLEKAIASSYAAIILDLNLPDIPGLEVCQKIRQAEIATPILILSGETKVMSKISLLDAGADDYLTKPFSLGELKARLRAMTRRSNVHPDGTPQLIAYDLVMDIDTRHVERDGQTISLRRKEFALLECLLQHAGSVVSRDTLSNYAWQDDQHPWTNTVDVHIKYLRDKIDRPFDLPLITTVHGLGYKLEKAQSSK